MKRVLFITAFSLTFFTAAIASIIPMEATTIINNAEVEVSLISLDQMSLFNSAKFNEDSDCFSFAVDNRINVIQIWSPDGNLAYQLPVASNKVRIHKTIFKKGQNRLGFVIQGMGAIEFTYVKVK